MTFILSRTNQYLIHYLFYNFYKDIYIFFFIIQLCLFFKVKEKKCDRINFGYYFSQFIEMNHSILYIKCIIILLLF